MLKKMQKSLKKMMAVLLVVLMVAGSIPLNVVFAAEGNPTNVNQIETEPPGSSGDSTDLGDTVVPDDAVIPDDAVVPGDTVDPDDPEEESDIPEEDPDAPEEEEQEVPVEEELEEPEPEPVVIYVRITVDIEDEPEEEPAFMLFSAEGDLFNGSDVVDGLTVRVFDLHDPDDPDDDELIGSATTANGGEAKIKLEPGVTLDLTKGYKVQVLGMKMGYGIYDEGTGTFWDEDGLGYSRTYTGEDLSTVLFLTLKETGVATFGISATINQDGKGQIEVPLTLKAFNRTTGELEDLDVTSSLASGSKEWRVTNKYYYEFSITSPSDTAFLTPNSFLNLLNFEKCAEYMGFVQDPDTKLYTYTWKIDFTNFVGNGVYYSMTFEETKGEITVGKTYAEGFTPDKPAYIGVAPGGNSKNIVWAEVIGNKVTLQVLKKTMEPKPLNLVINGTSNTASAPSLSQSLSYILYEYVPSDVQPQGSGWSWIEDTSGYKLPEDEKDPDYFLFVRSNRILFGSGLKADTAIENGKAKLVFEPEFTGDFFGVYNLVAQTGRFADWDIKKTALDPEVNLKSRGEQFSVRYEVDFTRKSEDVPSTTKLWFQNFTLSFSYDSRAARENNMIKGTITLYKIDPVTKVRIGDALYYDDEVEAYLKNGVGISDTLSRLEITILSMEAPDYKLGDSYEIAFAGGFYYAPDGNPNMDKPFQGIDLKGTVTPPADLPITTVSDIQDTTIKNFEDALTNLMNGADYTVVEYSDIKVLKNGVEVNPQPGNTPVLTAESLLSGFQINSTLVSGDNINKITVTYTTKFQNENVVPCTESYVIKNKAKGQKYDSNGWLEATAEVTVNLPTYLIVSIDKWESVLGGTEKQEKDREFALYQYDKATDTLTLPALGTATSDGKNVIVFAKSGAAIHDRPMDRDEYDRVVQVEYGGTYRIYLTNAKPGYPPYKEDGTKWEFDDVMGQYYIEFPAVTDTGCGRVSFKAINMPDSELTITKTGSGIAQARFYLVDNTRVDDKGNAIVLGPISPDMENGGKAVFKHLEFGSYTLYELTSDNYKPEGTKWTEVAAVEGITVNPGEKLYRYGDGNSDTFTFTAPVIDDGKTVVDSIGVKNQIKDILEIRKSAPNGVRAESATFTFNVFKEGEEGTPEKALHFTGTGPNYVYSSSATGAITDLTITLSESVTTGAIEITGLPDEGKYVVVELPPATIEGVQVYTTTEAGNPVSIGWGNNNSSPEKGNLIPVTFTNTLRDDDGKLTIEKHVTGAAVGNEEFTFEILDDQGEAILLQSSNPSFSNYVEFSPSDSGGLLTGLGNTHKFTLKAGGKITISKMPLGKKYTVTEVGATGGMGSYDTTVKRDDDVAAVPGVSVVLTTGVDEKDGVVFTNTRLPGGVLTIAKTLAIGSYVADDEVFIVKVEGKFIDGSNIVTTPKVFWFTKDGNAPTGVTPPTGVTIEVWDGTKVSVPGVIAGEIYTVTETTTKAGTDTTGLYAYTVEGGTKTADGWEITMSTAVKDVTVKNTRSTGSGDLIIEKRLTNSVEAGEEFIVRIKDAGGKYLTFNKSSTEANTYTYVSTTTDSTNSATAIAISQSVKATVKGLPLDAKLEVVEDEPGRGYVIVGYNNNGVPNGKFTTTADNQTIEVTNRPNDDTKLTVTKVVEPAAYAAADDEFTITVRGKFDDTDTPSDVVSTFVKPGSSKIDASKRIYAFGTVAEVPGVYAGATYTIIEMAEDKVLKKYDTAISWTAGSTTGLTATGIPVTAGATQAVTVTNTYKGNQGLKIRKDIDDITFVGGSEVFVVTVYGKFDVSGIPTPETRTYYFTKDGSATGVPDGTAADRIGKWGTNLTVSGVIFGEDYTVTEVDVIGGSLTNYTVSTKVDGTDSMDGAARAVTVGETEKLVSVNNTRKLTGKLRIEKDLENSSETDKEFTVYIKEQKTGGKYLTFTKSATGNTYTYLGTATDTAATGAAITISKDVAAVIEELPLGVALEVVEPAPGTGYVLDTARADLQFMLTAAEVYKTITVENTATSPILKITKDVKGYNGTDRFTITVSGIFGTDTTSSSKSFTFGPTASESPKVYEYKDEVKVDGVIAGETYTITETAANGANLSNYTTDITATVTTRLPSPSSRSARVKLTAEEEGMVTFTNTRNTDGKLTVKKAMSAGSWDDVDVFNFVLLQGTQPVVGATTNPSDPAAAGAITTDADGKFDIPKTLMTTGVTFYNLNADSDYVVKEVLKADSNYAFVNYAVDGVPGTIDTIDPGATVHTGQTVTVTNKRETTGQIVLTKEVVGALDENDEFRFVLKKRVSSDPDSYAPVTLTESMIADRTNIALSTDGGDPVLVIKAAAFSPNSGNTGYTASVTIIGLELGQKYQIEERSAGAKYDLTGIAVTGAGDTWDIDEAAATVTARTKDAEPKTAVTFTNTRMDDGEITLKKSASSEALWPADGFVFQLYRPDTLSSTGWSRIENTLRYAKNDTDAGKSVTWDGLTRGQKYRVYETNAGPYVPLGWEKDSIGYYLEVTVGTGQGAQSVTKTVVNKLTELTVEKIVANGDQSEQFGIQVQDVNDVDKPIPMKLSPLKLNGKDVKDAYVYDPGEDPEDDTTGGARTIYIQHNQTLTIYGLPYGEYSVKETVDKDYTPRYSVSSITFVKDDGTPEIEVLKQKVTITNTSDATLLVTKKVTNTLSSAYLDRDYTFQLFASDSVAALKFKLVDADKRIWEIDEVGGTTDTLTIRHDQTITIKGVTPSKTKTYTVRETNIPARITASYTGNGVRFDDGNDEKTIGIINRYYYSSGGGDDDPVNPPPIITILDGDIPLGDLPKTGSSVLGKSAGLLSLILLGLGIRRKTKKEDERDEE